MSAYVILTAVHSATLGMTIREKDTLKSLKAGIRSD